MHKNELGKSFYYNSSVILKSDFFHQKIRNFFAPMLKGHFLILGNFRYLHPALGAHSFLPEDDCFLPEWPTANHILEVACPQFWLAGPQFWKIHIR